MKYYNYVVAGHVIADLIYFLLSGQPAVFINSANCIYRSCTYRTAGEMEEQIMAGRLVEIKGYKLPEGVRYA